MERIKRPHTDTILDCNNNIIKKPKLDDTSSAVTINTKESLFEDLANETLYEIFDYLDINHSYHAFFDLNKRFENLFLYSNLPIQVNISTISRSSFERYHKNVIVPNKHRINYLRLSNPFTVDIVLSPPITISKFIQLETLVLDNINAKYLRNIFTHAIVLNKLHSLVLTLAGLVQDPTKLITWIFRLPKLKSCKITYQTKDGQSPSALFFSECTASSIEHLVINTRFQYESLANLLFQIPNLRHLSINCLVGYRDLSIHPSFTQLKHLKYVSLKLEGVLLKQLETLITNFFHHVEILRLTTRYDQAYLDAQQWKQIILSYMPNLRIFDINHDNSVRNSSLLYHDLINAFDSPFWIERGWFFTHQHTCQRSLDSEVFYSTDPYRRKDYTFHWELAGQICSHRQETNLNSVQHVRIGSKQLTDSSANYFPNATELTIQHYFETSDDSIITTLNRIVPLQQLTKLVIKSFDFPFEQILQLLHCTLNLHTLALNSIFIQKNSLKFIKQSDTFQYVSKANKIQNVKIHHSCNLESIPLIIDLFPRMEYFQTGMVRKEIEQIVQYVLTKIDNQTPHLYFICMSKVPKRCLREIDRLIKREKLLDDYFIKFVSYDLYLWW